MNVFFDDFVLIRKPTPNKLCKNTLIHFRFYMAIDVCVDSIRHTHAFLSTQYFFLSGFAVVFVFVSRRYAPSVEKLKMNFSKNPAHINIFGWCQQIEFTITTQSHAIRHKRFSQIFQFVIFLTVLMVSDMKDIFEMCGCVGKMQGQQRCSGVKK